MNLKKIIFITTLPRSSGNKILNFAKQYKNIVCWPYEFLYFSFFKKISNGKKKIIAKKLNTGLQKIILKKNSLNTNLFFKLLEKKNNQLFTQEQYLIFLFKTLFKILKLNKKDIKKYYFLIFTTSRGFDWSSKKILKKSLFILTDRNFYESFMSLKQKIFLQSDVLNFYHHKNSKNFSYWMEQYAHDIKNIRKYYNEANLLNLKFDNFNISKNKKEQIFKKNKLSFEKFLNIKNIKNIKNINNKKLVFTSKNLKENKFDKLCFEYLGLKNNIEKSSNHKKKFIFEFIFLSFLFYFFENFKLIFLINFKKIFRLYVNYFTTINKIINIKKNYNLTILEK
jgi:hypothetical protein